MSGRLLVLEGLDGVGKTTLAAALAERIGAVQIATPDAALRGARKEIESVYQNSPEAIHLFYASSVLHAGERAGAEIAAGRDVVVDRYWLSTWAYNRPHGSTLRLGEVGSRVRPADITFLLTAEHRERCRRLRARGAGSRDVETFDPAVAARIERRLRKGLRARVAGKGVVVDVTDPDLDANVAALASLTASMRV